MFQGRYGNDYLNRALSFTGIALVVLNLVLSLVFGPGSIIVVIIRVLTLACIAIILLRMFSRNFAARRRENELFIVFLGKAKARFSNVRWSSTPKAKTVRHNPTWEERRKYKYLICPQCAQRLRVPRGKGKLRVTCTRCGNKFDVKS